MKGEVKGHTSQDASHGPFLLFLSFLLLLLTAKVETVHCRLFSLQWVLVAMLKLLKKKKKC